jgi:2-haloacid dehalogenase
MMVAAHEDDLRAARKEGLRTAFVWRPREQGGARGRTSRRPLQGEYDIVADDFVALARRLKA